MNFLLHYSGDCGVNPTAARGHCGECHTPRTVFQGLNADHKFGGAMRGERKDCYPGAEIAVANCVIVRCGAHPATLTADDIASRRPD